MALRPVTLINNFSGGAAGATVVPGNSGGASGNPWDTAVTGAGATLAYDATRAVHYGEGYSCKVATTTPAQSYLAWSSSLLPPGVTSLTQVWFRAYLYFTALPAAATAVFFAGQSGGGTCATVRVNTNGTVSALGTAGTVACTTTGAVPAGQWFRLEAAVTGDPSNGAVSVSFYPASAADPYAHDSTILAAGNTASATGVGTLGPMTGWRFGQPTSAASVGPYWMGGCGLSDAGYLGPVGYGFTSVRVDDGGALTQVAQPPSGSTLPAGTLAAGGDVEGFFTTSNYGTNWQPAGTGVWSTQWRKCACIQWSAAEGATLYACVGDHGSGGGFLAGAYNAATGQVTWSMRSTQVQYAGNHSGSDLPAPADQSRSTGNLLAQVGTSDLMYTATYKGGVFRAKGTGSNHGSNWVNIGLGGGTHFGRSIAVSPASADTVYVCMYGEGVYQATNASTASPANFTLMAGSPAFPEEIVILSSGNIYVAAGYGGTGQAGYAPGGLWRYDGTSWSQIDPAGSFLVSSSYWMGIDGYTDAAGRDQVIISCNHPHKPSSAAGYRNMAWVTFSATGTPTFTDVTTNPPSIQTTYIPPDTGRTWWHTAAANGASGYQEWLGGKGSFQLHPLIDKSTASTSNVSVYVAGAAGFWISTGNTVGASGPTASPTPSWGIAVNGMALHVGHNVTVSPSNPSQFGWGTSDWCHFQVTDGTAYNATTTLQGGPPVAPPPAGQSVTEGYALAYDPAPPGPGTVFLSTGAKYNNDDGQIWAAPAGTLNFTNISAGGTSNPGTSGGQVAYGLYCGRLSAGTGAPFLLAFIQGGTGAGGVWRLTGFTISSTGAVSGGTWNLASTGALGTTGGQANIPTAVQAPFAADPGNPGYIYCFDQASGVWRSSNYGASWTSSPIYAAVNTDDRTGQIAVNPATANELWVSWSSGLYKISGANSGSAPAAAAVTGITAPGGICFAADGTVYCLALQVPAAGTRVTQLLSSVNGGTTWSRADNGSVAAAASKPSNMVMASTGRIYIATDANIVAYGYPAQPADTPAAQFAMGMALAATGSDVTGTTKNATAAFRMGMTLAAGSSHAGQAAAQFAMGMALTTSGGAQALIVQQVNGYSTFDYGISTVEMATTTGNCLVVLAGWDLSAAPVTAPMPAVNVADSAGNYWIHVATTTAGVSGSRSSAWICPNAAAITWLSVSLTTFAGSLAYTVLEVSGMPSLFALDVMAANGNASAAQLALAPGPASDSGFAFAVLTTGAVVPPPPVPAGWNALTTSTSTGSRTAGTTGGGVAPAGPAIPAVATASPAHVFPYFRTPAPGTSLNVTFTLPQAVPVSGVVFCARQTVYPPYQPDPEFPVLKVEAGFGATPGDPSQAPPVWTDITQRCVSKDGDFFIQATAGRQYELTAPEAGTLAITMDNHDGAFTPGGPNAWPGVALEIPVRVSAFWGGSWYPVGYGWVERWPQEWPDLPQWGLSKMTATDAISVMAAVTMVSAMDADTLIDAPYVLLPAAEQYLSFSNGLSAQGILGSYNVTDAQGLTAQNVSRVNQRAGMYVDGVGNVPGGTAPAVAQTGQTTSLLGTAATGFGTTAIGTTTAPSGPLSGPGIIYTDPNLPGPPTGVTVSFWVIIPATVAVAGLQPTVFTAYGPPSSYPPGHASLSVQIQNLAGGTSTLKVTLADGSAVTAPFSASATAQRITLSVTSYSLSVYVNGALAATTGLTAGQVTAWNAVTLGCPNYAYGAGGNVAGNFTAFGLAIHACQLPVQRIVSQYNTGISGQQNAGALQRVAQILSWAGLGVARAGRTTFSGQPDGVLQGPAYALAGTTAAQAVAQVAASGAGMAAAMAGGEVVYISRWGLLNQSPVCVLGDSTDPTAGQIPFQPGQSFGYDNTYLANIGQTSQQYGPNTLFTAVGADLGSEQQYFPRAGPARSITTMSALDAVDSVNWGLAKYSQPSLRVATVTIDAAAAWQQAFPAVLALRQGQVATVTRDPVGGPAITQNFLIQKITHAIGPKKWQVTLQLSPYSLEANVLQLDTPGFDVAGGNALA